MLYFALFIAFFIISPAVLALIIPKRIVGFFSLLVLVSSPILTVLTWQYFASEPDYGGGGNGLGAFIFSLFVIIGLSVSFTVGLIRYVINRDKPNADDPKANEDSV